MMGGPSIIHLPDGQNFTVTPVFAGLFFKSHELSTHHNAFPIGWTVVLHTEETSELESEPRRPYFPVAGEKRKDDDGDGRGDGGGDGDGNGNGNGNRNRNGGGNGSSRSIYTRIKAYTRPTLHNDCLFISSISNPSSSDFKPAASPTRQIAMMLWITLYWYFHQPQPPTILPPTAASSGTPEEGRPRGGWRISVKKDGVLRGRNLIPKLERMGLIATLDSAVGTTLDDAAGADAGWQHMFVSRQAFWQIPARLFLFTLQPNPRGGSSSYPGSPVGSRPGSPSKQLAGAGAGVGGGGGGVGGGGGGGAVGVGAEHDTPSVAALMSAPSFPIGPFFSSSHLPTYYPPGPPQYTMTGHVRHPVRPKPPRMGEVFYCRFVPSAGAYLSFRVASLSPKPVPYLGPVGSAHTAAHTRGFSGNSAGSGSGGSGGSGSGSGSGSGEDAVHAGSSPGPRRRVVAALEHSHLSTLSDTSLLQMWLNKPRVHSFWGSYVPDFLSRVMASRHSFPVIALWDGVPFAYLEIYWVKEDVVGRYLGGAGGSVADDWDRGVHVLIGEEWARGQVQLWLSSVVHWIFTTDYRTMSVCMEPRVDNKRFIQHLQAGGFDKETELSMPHKQAWFGRLRRENWHGPTL